MKINGSLYETIKSGFRTVIDHYGGPASYKSRFGGKNDRSTMWGVWHTFVAHKTYGETHPMFRKGRILPHEPNWDVYATDETINDDHIETAIMKIGRELGMV